MSTSKKEVSAAITTPLTETFSEEQIETPAAATTSSNPETIDKTQSPKAEKKQSTAVASSSRKIPKKNEESEDEDDAKAEEKYLKEFAARKFTGKRSNRKGKRELFEADFESPSVLLAIFVARLCFTSHRTNKKQMATNYLNVMKFLDGQGVDTWHRLSSITKNDIEEKSYHLPKHEFKTLEQAAYTKNDKLAEKLTEYTGALSDPRVEAMKLLNEIPPRILQSLIKSAPREEEINESYLGFPYNSRTGKIITKESLFSLNSYIKRRKKETNKSPKVTKSYDYSVRYSEISTTTEGEAGISVPIGPVPVSASLSASRTEAQSSLTSNSKGSSKAVTSSVSLDNEKHFKYFIPTEDEIRGYNLEEGETKELIYISNILRNIRETPAVKFQYEFAKIICATGIFEWLLHRLYSEIDTNSDDVISLANDIINRKRKSFIGHGDIYFKKGYGYNVVDKTEFEKFYIFLTNSQNGGNLLAKLNREREKIARVLNSFLQSVKSNKDIDVERIRIMNSRLKGNLKIILQDIINLVAKELMENTGKDLTDAGNKASYDKIKSDCNTIEEQLNDIIEFSQTIEESNQNRHNVKQLILEYKKLSSMLHPNRYRQEVLDWEAQTKKDCFDIVGKIILGHISDYYGMTFVEMNLRDWLELKLLEFKKIELCAFFEEYGTHYVSKVEFGAVITEDNSKKELENQLNSKYAGSVGVYGQKVGGSRSKSRKDSNKKGASKKVYIGGLTEDNNVFQVTNSTAIESTMYSLWHLYKTESANSSARNDYMSSISKKLQESALMYQWMDRAFLIVFSIENGRRVLFAYKSKGKLKWKDIKSKEHLQRLISNDEVHGVAYEKRAFLFQPSLNNKIYTVKDRLSGIIGEIPILVPNSGSLERNCSLFLKREGEYHYKVVAPIPEKKLKILRKGLPRREDSWNSRDYKGQEFNPKIPLLTGLRLHRMSESVDTRLDDFEYSNSSKLLDKDELLDRDYRSSPR